MHMRDPELPDPAPQLVARRHVDRYMYDADAPRYARLRTREVGFPALTVGVTDSGTFAVITDPSTPPHLVGHALDYADRLAELIPVPRSAAYIGKHRRPEPEPEPPRGRGWLAPWFLVLMVTSQVLVSCAGAGWGG